MAIYRGAGGSGDATNDASNEATVATTKAAEASTSATNAATSASNTESIYTNFDARYLGAKSSNPSLDNDGNALVIGAVYFNTALSEMRVYTVSGWTAAYTSGSSLLLE